MDENAVSKNEQERAERLKGVKVRRLKRAIKWVIVLAIIAGAIYGIAAWQKYLEQHKPGTAYLDQGREHIAVGAEHAAYNSNPPTSGPHYAEPAPWGFYDEALPDEQLVHNLEHGGVWIAYKNSEDAELKAALKKIADDYTVKVIVTPRPQNDARISVAAWTRLLAMETYDETALRDFIKAFINRGPEKVPY